MSRVLQNNFKYMEPALAAVEKRKKDSTITREQRVAALKSTYQNENLAREWAAHRTESYSLTILPDLIASELFEMIPIGKGDRIQINTTYNAEYEVKEINQMSGAPRNSWASKDGIEMRDVYQIATDEVTYPIEDIIQGNIDKSDEVNRDVEFSYKNKIDQDVWTLFTSVFADAFTSNTVYRRHSRVLAANVPTTNIVDASSEGAFTVSAAKQLLEHCELADVVPRIMYISPQDKADIWDWTSVVAGYTAGDMVKAKDVISLDKHSELWQSGKINSIFGYPLIFKTLNFLASGTIYVGTNKPSGKLYFKPDYERTIFYTQNECRKLLKLPRHEAIAMEGVIKPLIEAPLYLNSVKLLIA